MSSRGVKAGNAYITISVDDKEAMAQLLKFENRLKAISLRMSNMGRLGIKMPPIAVPLRQFKQLSMTIPLSIQPLRSLGAVSIAVGRNITRATAAFGNFGRSLSRMGGKIVNFRNIAIGGFGFALALKEASDIESLEGRFGQVFGNMTGEMRKFADDLAREVNRSPRVIRDALSQYQGILRGIGHSNETAAVMSGRAVRMQLDIEAFKDDLLVEGQALRTLVGGMTGSNTEGIATVFGAATRGVDLQRELGVVAKDLSLAEASLARQELIFKAMSDAGIWGQAAREAHQLATTMKSAAEAARDLAGAILLAVSEPIKKLLASFSKLSVQLTNWVNKNKEAMMQMGKIALGILGVGVAFSVLGTVITSISVVMSVIVGAVGSLLTGIMALLTPLGLLATALTVGAVRFLDWGAAAKHASEEVKRAISDLIAWFGPLQDAMREALNADKIQMAFQIAFTAAELGIRTGLARLLVPLDQFRLKVGKIWLSIAQAVSIGVLRTAFSVEMRFLELEQAFGQMMIRFKHSMNPLNFAAISGYYMHQPLDEKGNPIPFPTEATPDMPQAVQDLLNDLNAQKKRDKMAHDARKEVHDEWIRDIKQGYKDTPGQATGLPWLFGESKWMSRFLAGNEKLAEVLNELIEKARLLYPPKEEAKLPGDVPDFGGRGGKGISMRTATQGVTLSGMAPRAFLSASKPLELIDVMEQFKDQDERNFQKAYAEVKSIGNDVSTIREDIRQGDGPKNR